MNWLALRRRITSSLTALALLWAALAPTISWALSNDLANTPNLLAVCSSTGLKYVKVVGDTGPGNGTSDPAPASTTALDCPYCLLAAHWGLEPTFHQPVIHPASTPRLQLATSISEPKVQTTWYRPPSHGPPIQGL